MLKNYLKIAWKVLLRRKFFTFISLFGISFTIFVLTVAASIIDFAISPDGPQKNDDRTLYLNGIVIADSTRNNNIWSSNPSFHFMNTYVRTMKTPELISVYTQKNPYSTYRNGRKLSFTYKYTDPEFWKIFKFNFLYGKPYGTREYESGEKSAVISKGTAETYFGRPDPLGDEINVDGMMFRIIGVVENVSIANKSTYSDIWVPSVHSPDYLNKIDYLGNWSAAILAYKSGDALKIKQEFHHNLVEAMKRTPEPKWQHVAKAELKTALDELSEELTRGDFEGYLDRGTTFFKDYVEEKGLSGKDISIIKIVAAMFLFMLLPAINLVNINLSRILERASEIGVRKAFGASRGKLIIQFIIENLILTFIGGAISYIFTIGALLILNDSGLLPNTVLTINIRVFLASLTVCFLFAMIAGVYPAFKMSKLNPVEALRGGE